MIVQPFLSTQSNHTQTVYLHLLHFFWAEEGDVSFCPLNQQCHQAHQHHTTSHCRAHAHSVPSWTHTHIHVHIPYIALHTEQ